VYALLLFFLRGKKVAKETRPSGGGEPWLASTIIFAHARCDTPPVWLARDVQDVQMPALRQEVASLTGQPSARPSWPRVSVPIIVVKWVEMKSMKEPVFPAGILFTFYRQLSASSLQIKNFAQFHQKRKAFAISIDHW
jgi:hypothetical protein